MISLEDKLAVITGASSGIGKAIALRLAREKAKLCLLGRNIANLKTVETQASKLTPEVRPYCLDITDDQELLRFADTISNTFHGVDVLVHSAGMISLGRVESANIKDFDNQYQTNVRAPFLLTQLMLPMLRSCRGQVVFINSSAGLNAGANIGQYSATKHALKAIADSLRHEVNNDGIRVLSVYPGRTATPMQAAIIEAEGKIYQAEHLLQPDDIAEAVIGALNLPMTAELTDINVRPMIKF